MKKYSKEDQKILAIWAADCAQKVLPFFKKNYPEDKRPQQAIKVCLRWAKTGIFKMADIRKASLDAHAAARQAKDNNAACFVARATGQAVATAHVTQHAYGSSYYALKAVNANNPNKVVKMYNWQMNQLPKRLQGEIMNRIIITQTKKGFTVKINKDNNF